MLGGESRRKLCDVFFSHPVRFKAPDELTMVARRHPLPHPTDRAGADVRTQRALQGDALPADLGRYQVQGEGLDRRVRVAVREGGGVFRDSEQQGGPAKAGNIRRRGQLLDQVRVRPSCAPSLSLLSVSLVLFSFPLEYSTMICFLIRFRSLCAPEPHVHPFLLSISFSLSSFPVLVLLAEVVLITESCACFPPNGREYRWSTNCLN